MSISKDVVQSACAYCHDRLWDHFVGIHGDHAFIYTYADLDQGWEKLVPTKEEIANGIPDDLIGAKTPIENCCIEAGFYVDSLLATVYPLAEGDEKEQMEKECRLLVKGLLALAEAGARQGFIPRGVALDGKSHYRVSSVDQYTTALAALWRYYGTPFATDDEKLSIANLLVDVVSVVQSDNYYLKYEDNRGYWRGELPRYSMDRASRLLEFFAIAMDVTSRLPALAKIERRWGHVYWRLREQDDRMRLKLCLEGYTEEGATRIAPWMYQFLQDAVALRALREIEEDPEVRDMYRTGLRNAADATARFVDFYQEFPADPSSGFNYDWRKAHQLRTQRDGDEWNVGGYLAELNPNFHCEVTKLDGAFEAALPVLMTEEEDLIRPIFPHVEGMLAMTDGLETALVHTMDRALMACWWLRKFGV